jgi:hypothetical protein
MSVAEEQDVEPRGRPVAFRTQVRLLERRLRSANTASNAEEHILEIRAALDAMRRILDSAEAK